MYLLRINTEIAIFPLVLAVIDRNFGAPAQHMPEHA